MSAMEESAKLFFEACETGKGWEGCKKYCLPNATFSAQTGVLSGVNTLEAYCEWMKGLFTPIPNASYELRFFAADEARKSVAAYALFKGTQTGPGGPVPATGKSISADYVYVMVYDDDRIKHMTKIWHDGESLKQLGWA